MDETEKEMDNRKAVEGGEREDEETTRTRAIFWVYSANDLRRSCRRRFNESSDRLHLHDSSSHFEAVQRRTRWNKRNLILVSSYPLLTSSRMQRTTSLVQELRPRWLCFRTTGESKFCSDQTVQEQQSWTNGFFFFVWLFIAFTTWELHDVSSRIPFFLFDLIFLCIFCSGICFFMYDVCVGFVQSTIGQALHESLQEMINQQKITAELGLHILTIFDEVLCCVLLAVLFEHCWICVLFLSPEISSNFASEGTSNLHIQGS